jgi:uncharacterized protein YbjT (DUF2867 family)
LQLLERVKASTEVVEGDVAQIDTLRRALEGIDTAFYLVHAMGGTDSHFADADRTAAHNFATAARENGLRRIIYLGGLGRPGDLSPHLESRQEVGRILRESGVPTVELRASIIIGSGSLSFELIRALVERLPVMTTPRWVRGVAQPIAVEDVLDYLEEALHIPLPESRTFEIGGAERASYQDIMKEYARQHGLKRTILPIPVLTPKLSSLWLGLVTPVYARVGSALIEGVRNDTVVNDPAALEAFTVRPRGLAAAIERALANEDREFALTRWSDAYSSRGRLSSYGGVRYGSRVVDSRATVIPCSPTDAFKPIARIGGGTGWYFANFLWWLRGALDLLVGGVGMRRGRRHPETLRTGDTVDFWRVEACEPPRLLRLHAEMKLPGRAWLQFEVDPLATGARIRQTALFEPRGLLGTLYWYALYLAHALIFRGMLRGIARAALHESEGTAPRNGGRNDVAARAGLAHTPAHNGDV